MLDRFARWFWGAVKFRILGSPERFFNHCARNGIALWKWREGRSRAPGCAPGSTGSCAAARAKPAAGFARRSGHGLPFSASFLRRRRGLPAGAALGALLLILLSQQVWSVEFTGLQTISEQEIAGRLPGDRPCAGGVEGFVRIPSLRSSSSCSGFPASPGSR